MVEEESYSRSSSGGNHMRKCRWNSSHWTHMSSALLLLQLETDWLKSASHHSPAAFSQFSGNSNNTRVRCLLTWKYFNKDHCVLCLSKCFIIDSSSLWKKTCRQAFSTFTMSLYHRWCCSLEKKNSRLFSITLVLLLRNEKSLRRVWIVMLLW